jgi:hypothetical protein
LGKKWIVDHVRIFNGYYAYFLQMTSQGHQLDLKALELVEAVDTNYLKIRRMSVTHHQNIEYT